MAVADEVGIRLDANRGRFLVSHTTYLEDGTPKRVTRTFGAKPGHGESEAEASEAAWRAAVAYRNLLADAGVRWRR